MTQASKTENPRFGTSVAGKRILVIGAGSIGEGMGNGKAASLLYAAQGGKLLCVDRNITAAQQTVDLITAQGGTAYALAGDVTDAQQVKQIMQACDAHFGGLDILHFNVGTSRPFGVMDTELDEWQQTFATNVESAFLLTKAALPMLEQDAGGSIVYISSLAAIRGGPYSYISYEASKAALCRFAQSVALEYASRGVRANTILPGTIDTPHVKALISPDTDAEQLAKNRSAMVPMRKQGTAWDVAEAALFLASDAANYITAIELPVDGGLSKVFTQ